MPTIRIDDDVWSFLQRKAIPLKDTPNNVLRRELNIAKANGDDGAGVSGYNYQPYNRSKVRSLCVALGETFHRDDVREFSQRLIHELCEEGSPAMTSRTFWQLAKWCKTAGAYEAGMEYAQKISMSVFGRIIERR